MKPTVIAILAAGSLLASCASSTDNSAPVDLVDPMIGTGFHGHTFPGATTPFGAVQFSSDTRAGNWDACSGYHYSDSTITGFSLTHLSGTGCCDLGDILFSPTSSENPLPFSHKAEKATPGFYEVTFSEPGIKAELTAAEHCGMARFTYPEGTPAEVRIDLRHELSTGEPVDSAYLATDGSSEVYGLRMSSGWSPLHRVYFAAQFSEPFQTATVAPDSSAVVLTFAPGRPVTLRVAVSGVSVDNARRNLKAEMPDFDFESQAAKARSQWETALSRIEIEGGSLNDRRTFYTALYHCMIAPNVVSDVDGAFRRNNQQVGMAPKGSRRYSTMSIWDTFRAWHPLMTILDPQLVSDMTASMLDMYDATGELPIWPLGSNETKCMIGYHAASVITDAYIKGIGGFDPRAALDAMIKSSNINEKGSDYYTTTGFIPANFKRESVSCQLEYAYDDWCIATMAAALGDTAVARKYYERAASYANVFDGNTRYFRGKRSDGNWMLPFEPRAVDRNMTEATPWQYRFFAPHDVNGLANLFGGTQQLADAIDSLFTANPELIGEQSDITGMIGQYAHGNEPSHHIAYLYNYLGQPWKTQQWTRRLLSEMYAPTPEGIIGNEDCGQMSAWYVMSALGLYPVCPGSGEYAITTPLFPKATISLPGGKKFEIRANNPERNVYIESVTLNGSPVETNFITHAQIMQGGVLDFKLTDKPVTTRGTQPQAAPMSMTKQPAVSVPYVAQDLYLFVEKTPVTMGSATQGAKIYYTLDGSEPTEKSTLYTAPFTLTESATVKARAFKQGMTPSRIMTVKAERANLVKAANVTPTVPGVAFEYYEGPFERTAHLSGAKALESGVMPAPSIDKARKEDHFGYKFSGYIYAPADGVYTFMTKSDDGSVLRIDGVTVVDNDGGHSAVAATGQIALAKGYHPFTLLYFEDYEGQELSWGWATPGTLDIKPIPTANTFAK